MCRASISRKNSDVHLSFALAFIWVEIATWYRVGIFWQFWFCYQKIEPNSCCSNTKVIQLWALHKIKFCIVVSFFFKSTCHVRCFYFSSLNKADMLVLDCLWDAFIWVEICKCVWSLAFPTWSTIHILEHMIFSFYTNMITKKMKPHKNKRWIIQKFLSLWSDSYVYSSQV